MERRSSSIRSIQPSSPIPIRSIAACAKPPRYSRRRRACGWSRATTTSPSRCATSDSARISWATSNAATATWPAWMSRPVIVICDMLGIPEEQRAPFLAGSNVNGRILEPVPMSREELDQANRNTQMPGAYFHQLCELRPRDPKDALTSDLGRADEAGDKLTAEELQANIGLLFGAGHETTTNLIGNGLLALHRHPDQWERLKADPSLIPNAVEELLRFDSSVQMTGRATMTEVEIGGVTLPAGESVVQLLGAANRDPAQYADPDRLDVGRQNIRPMPFGGGTHPCLGAQLARLEGELVFTALIERFPNLELPERDTPDWRQ